MTEHDIIMCKVEGRVLTYLHRIKTYYERSLYDQIGRGVTVEEYTTIIDKLVRSGVLKRITSRRGANILQWVEQPGVTNGNTVNA